MITYTFGFGSLLNPASLQSTLPDTVFDRLVPARLKGYKRVWNVAFPNDGSQPDKAYFDADNGRPPYILFVNVVPTKAEESVSVNGVLIPIDSLQLPRLEQRELRYRPIDVTGDIEIHGDVEPDAPSGEFKVVAFVGKEEFTRPETVQKAVIPKGYLNSIYEGVSYWNERFPGFEREFRESTSGEEDRIVADLRRIDL